jgi:hypothetical protein
MIRTVIGEKIGIGANDTDGFEHRHRSDIYLCHELDLLLNGSFIVSRLAPARANQKIPGGLLTHNEATVLSIGIALTFTFAMSSISS